MQVVPNISSVLSSDSEANANYNNNNNNYRNKCFYLDLRVVLLGIILHLFHRLTCSVPRRGSSVKFQVAS